MRFFKKKYMKKLMNTASTPARGIATPCGAKTTASARCAGLRRVAGRRCSGQLARCFKLLAHQPCALIAPVGGADKKRRAPVAAAIGSSFVFCALVFFAPISHTILQAGVTVLLQSGLRRAAGQPHQRAGNQYACDVAAGTFAARRCCRRCQVAGKGCINRRVHGASVT
jgi:hypothetical protein